MVVKFFKNKPIELKAKMKSLKFEGRSVKYSDYSGNLYIKDTFRSYVCFYNVKWDRHVVDLINLMYVYLIGSDYGLSHEFERLLQMVIEQVKKERESNKSRNKIILNNDYELSIEDFNRSIHCCNTCEKTPYSVTCGDEDNCRYKFVGIREIEKEHESK